MKVWYVANDGKKFDNEAACLRHEQESPLFRTYGPDGRPVEVGLGVYLVHIIEEGEGGKAFSRLCEEEGVDAGGIDSYTEAGWHAWDEFSFEPVNERLVHAMMRARYNVEPTD